MKKRGKRVVTILMVSSICLMTIALLISAAVSGNAEAEAIDFTYDPEPIVTTVEIKYTPTPIMTNENYIFPEEIEQLDGFDYSISRIAQCLWGECRGCTMYEQSLVVWCILNRLDSGRYGDNIEDVVIESQFLGYSPDNPVEKQLYDIAKDVVMRYMLEKYTVGNVGRTLPKAYLHFRGDGKHNYFYTGDGEWSQFDFSSPDPYGDKPF